MARAGQACARRLSTGTFGGHEMSLELYAFVDPLPDRHIWQRAIDQTGFDLKLDPDLDLKRDRGFSPCQIQGRASGFEINVMTAAELLGEYPELIPIVGARPHVVCFRWGGDFAEAACVLAASLALAKNLSSIVYDPAEKAVCEIANLEKETRECLAEL